MFLKLVYQPTLNQKKKKKTAEEEETEVILYFRSFNMFQVFSLFVPVTEF